MTRVRVRWAVAVWNAEFYQARGVAQLQLREFLAASRTWKRISNALRRRRSRPPAFFSITHALLHGFRKLLLVLGQQRASMLVVRLVADRVDPRAKVLA